ncbi:hypothetical protein GCM10009127_09250 [Alteraurantiacibacter aestuarii]|uniref:C-type cytochrome n=1 Tax=Alteraurantiacibacter aestuarii TaxID=650004 RepID=A0A844ZIQ3_9SPHN|nr:cytochrome c [Alteraurantiacibacter aestuarii]MXO87313.1 c-type cytochrome [Alteraurantiacibacter aestuarii]
MRYLALACAAAVAALALNAAQAQGETAPRTAPRTGQTAPELQRGKAVFAHWCAPCHATGAGLAGTMSLEAKYDGSVPAALEDRTDLQPAVIGYFVRTGVAWMPPFRPTEISDDDLAALSAYLSAPLADRGAHAPLLADEMVRARGSEQ